MKVVFSYIGQLHQMPHSLPIAAEMAQRHPNVEVEVVAATDEHIAWAREKVGRHAPGASLAYRVLQPGWLDRARIRAGLGSIPCKQYTLLSNRRVFAGAAAVVAPERTSLFLRHLGLGATKLIWTRHGAGDRAVGFADDIRRFDYVLMAGRKIERRLLDRGLIRPGRYAAGIYAKFDWAAASASVRPPLFHNGRPTVLYNPHFRASLSSWERMGEEVLEAFARSDRYNLIFAPHVRLFEGISDARRRTFERYAKLDNVHVDLGSERSIDMTYTLAADLYLGDVSSQLAEFLIRPRPCLFLDAHDRAGWRSDPNYESWHLGPVLRSTASLENAVADAFARHASYRGRQERYLDATFGIEPGTCTAARGADAIVTYLQREQRASASKSWAPAARQLPAA